MLLGSAESAPSSVIDPEPAWRVHVADSLSGLGFDELRSALRIADVGSGAGFPGLVLAAMLPDARVDLIEANTRKSEFIERAARRGGIVNAHAVNDRAEDWARGDGRERYDAVSARAVARLSTLAELASPLLRDGGVLVAWKGRRDPDEEAELERGAPRLAM
jgi:16S rRNA (guanine527-N7)-methyltransferase